MLETFFKEKIRIRGEMGFFGITFSTFIHFKTLYQLLCSISSQFEVFLHTIIGNKAGKTDDDVNWG